MEFDKFGKKTPLSAEIIPETDQQEFWEQNGRIKALKAFVALRETMSTKDIIAMLGGEPNE
ncbi:hypothetical protein CLNEO_05230 [Anaerotignum neopropionicum]|uniref:Uncharacterized protein n=1 Tax=Anaerotignum neopropionicum TaxID=36847 RepID=A0A136WIV6_9FIRM|nr:hypothetical protein [Anaerotignum neopropionicum]KXL54417.1 hypothetical protein CLNEO_05230 [Anaerotignum neopropionicum]